MTSLWKLPGFTLSLAGMDEAPPKGRLRSAWEALAKRRASGEVGFFDWPERATEQIPLIEGTARALSEASEGALCLGIGGSCLGPLTLLQALRGAETDRRYPIYWISNFDPPAAARAKSFAAERRVAGIAISKSGGTIETLAALYHLAGDVRGPWAAVTDPGAGELHAIAKAEGWHHVPMPKNVGGRFSVLTAVGLLPAALGGIDVAALLEGARETKGVLQGAAPEENPAARLAWALFAADESGRKIQVFMPYWSSLALFADWFVQLWAESLGKRRLADGAPVGPSPFPALGTTDQHSLLQLLKEGPGDKTVGFLSIEDGGETVVGRPPFAPGASEYVCRHPLGAINHEASLATEESLRRSGVPTWRLTLPRLDARALGGLFLFLETACAIAGELYGVNAYDQPGVEEAKKLLRERLGK